jgi:hypothetical protein
MELRKTIYLGIMLLLFFSCVKNPVDLERSEDKEFIKMQLDSILMQSKDQDGMKTIESTFDVFIRHFHKNRTDFYAVDLRLKSNTAFHHVYIACPEGKKFGESHNIPPYAQYFELKPEFRNYSREVPVFGDYKIGITYDEESPGLLYDHLDSFARLPVGNFSITHAQGDESIELTWGYLSGVDQLKISISDPSRSKVLVERDLNKSMLDNKYLRFNIGSKTKSRNPALANLKEGDTLLLSIDKIVFETHIKDVDNINLISTEYKEFIW